MPSNLSKTRLHKAFNEGRRSAMVESAENPYDNAKLRALWEQGRSMQRAGELKTAIPPLEHGETRAQRTPRNPPRPKRPAPPPRGPRNDRGGSGGYGRGRPRGRY